MRACALPDEGFFQSLESQMVGGEASANQNGRSFAAALI
jgi:hypothetical protein